MTTSDNTMSNRRQILTMTLGGAALLGLAETPAYAAQVSQAAVRYQQTAFNGRECSGCKSFVKPNSCKTVAGEINPKGWCKIWVKA